MLRKSICILLALLLCISIIACNNPQSNTNGMQQSTNPDIQTENSKKDPSAAIVIHVTINPAFKIHVDKDGIVIFVECLNEDAKAIHAQVVTAGKSCVDAVALILDETVQQGFLKNGGKIEVVVSVAEELANQLDTWNATVMNSVTHALTKNSLNASIKFDSQIINNQQNANSDPNASSTNTQPSETDANGNTVLRSENGYITIDQNGNKVLEVYTTDDGTFVTLNYNEGTLAFQRDERADGTWSEYAYKDDNIIQEVYTTIDDHIITQRYDDGEMIFQHVDYTDGSWSEHTYKNGLPLKEISEFFNGAVTIHQETEFYENGNRKSAYTSNDSNASYSEIRYYENGIKSYEYNFIHASQYTEYCYDQEGKKETEKTMDADGTFWDLKYNPDGSHYGYTYYPDGSVWYNEWDANDVQNLAAQKRIK